MGQILFYTFDVTGVLNERTGGGGRGGGVSYLDYLSSIDDGPGSVPPFSSLDVVRAPPWGEGQV